jgi:hypothetical protein
MLFGRRRQLPEHLARRLDAHRQRADVARTRGAEGARDDADALALVVVGAAADAFAYPDETATLARRKLPYELDDVELLVWIALDTDRADPTWRALPRARVAVSALERYAKAHPAFDAAEVAGRLLPWLERCAQARGWGAGDWPPVIARVRRFLPVMATQDVSMLGGKDGWAPVARSLATREFGDFGSGPLLRHLATATAARPAKAWSAAARPLVDGRGADLVRRLLEAALAVEEREIAGPVYPPHWWLVEPSPTVIRGALWCLPLVPADAWQVPLATALLKRAMRSEHIKVANGALYALGELEGDEAVTILGGLVTRVRDRRFLPGIERALDAAAARRGMSRGELRETLVPRFDLADDGTVAAPVGGWRGVIAVTPSSTVTLTWEGADGSPSRGVPAEVREWHAEGLAALKRHQAEIRAELGVQRRRLEDLLAADRRWSLDSWRANYLDHPLVGVLARTLLWRVDGVAVLPREGRLERVDGALVDVDGDATVELWHPIAAPVDEVIAWRARLRELELVQPFKQAFREIYAVAPAERETGTYSNRFAAHIVEYPRLYALAKGRGWGVTALGPYDNGGGRQWRGFEEHGLRVEFWLEPVDDGVSANGLLMALASTDQVRFVSTASDDAVPVGDVPAVVFSEAMRDVDLFVGVTSVAADPSWLDHGPERFHAYWREYAFGELTESAVSRREALAAVLPGLRIADRCTLEDRFLVVRGNLRTYRIHLGSANILMEPDSRYLCIVPARTAAPKVYLPFGDDDRLAVILSKAQMLADDDRIADPSIRAQIAA